MFRKTIFLFLVFSFLISAQDKLFDTRDVIINSYRSLAPQKPKGLTIIPDSDYYTYISEENNQQVIIRGNVISGTEENLVYFNAFSRIVEDAGINKPAKFPKTEWLSPALFLANDKNSYYLFNTDDNVVVSHFELPDNAENTELSPDKKMVAYTKDNNLYVWIPEKGEIAITNESDKGIVSGQAVHRSEFGIEKGIFWSPDGKKIAFYKMDETMVTDYPILDIDPLPAEVEYIKYPMAGGKSHHVTVGIYNTENNSTVFLNTGEPAEQYLTCLTWAPDSKDFYIAHLNRDQNHMKLTKYNSTDGTKTGVLFEESDEKYVEPEHPLYFVPGNDNQFVWISERDGFDHFYLYDTSGKLIKQLTKGEWVVLSMEGFDHNGNIIFTSTIESPVGTQLYSCNIESGVIKKLTNEKGTHNIDFSDGGKYYIDMFNSMDTPGYVAVASTDGSVNKQIKTFDNPIADYHIGKTEIFTVTNPENTTLYCQAVYPPDFDSTKTYPVVVYVYGGPHVQLVKDEWPRGRYAFWFMEMAQKGYIVFTVDSRGSANRGKEFEQETFRQLGTKEVEDQVFALKEFLKTPYTDDNRVGVFGWSYGGFMTTSLMLKANDLYKVGVGGGAVIDWKYYEIMYTERYMDTPETNPEGYKEASLLNHIDNLKGKLLLVHGTSDPTVVWQNTLMFTKLAMNKSIPLDYFPYVGHPHGVGGNDAIHLYDKITKYFTDNL